MKDVNVEGPSGLGGWLILVGIGVVVTLLAYINNGLTIVNVLTDDGLWSAILMNNSALIPVVWGEMIYGTIMIIASIAAVVLYFKQHHLFPTLYITMYIAAILFIAIDSIAVAAVTPGMLPFGGETMARLFIAIVGATIWIPYMLYSKRVKNTFKRREPTGGYQPTDSLTTPPPKAE